MSHPDMLRFISANTVPVALNLFVIREQRDAAGDFFRAVQKQRPAQYQGLYLVAPDGKVADANVAAEAFFEVSLPLLRRHILRDLVPFGSPLLTLVEQVRLSGAAVNEYKVDLGTPRNPGDRSVDLHVAPLAEQADYVVVMLQERSIAEKMDRQLTHRGAARSVSALAAMLAHEIKNPLSGIRGAAQLLEQSVGDDDRTLTRLICDEADRIVKLVDRMEVFSDERPVEREPINIHVVLDHVKRLAQSGVARHIKFVEDYDPSLPPVLANRDQLVQVFLNLVKNAAEAFGMGDKLGSLDVGKIANLVIADGDPLDVRTSVKQVYINGVAIPMETRQTKLRDEYWPKK